MKQNKSEIFSIHNDTSWEIGDANPAMIAEEELARVANEIAKNNPPNEQE